MMIEHKPDGDPCNRCGYAVSRHRKPRLHHAFVRPKAKKTTRKKTVACARCGSPRADHPAKRVLTKRKKYDSSRGDRKGRSRCIGIDGEGHDLPCEVCKSSTCEDPTHGPREHLYTYLAAVDEHGELLAEARNPKGLTHDECAELLLSLPKNSLKFGFSLGYDLAMWLRELPLHHLYYLVRPDTRRRRICGTCKAKWNPLAATHCQTCGPGHATRTITKHVRWNKRGYDVMGKTFIISDGFDPVTRKWDRSRTIHDVFKFFQTSFVKALAAWSIGTKDERAAITAMKNQRGALDWGQQASRDVESYCRKECELLARLMRTLIDAHKEVELELRRFEGAGSTASLLLKKYEVADHRSDPSVEDLPKDLRGAIHSAFSGGRFENSVVGRIDEPIEGFDIRSAYPYALSDLPCLAHGKWRHIKAKGAALMKQVDRATLAVVRFKVKALSEAERKAMAWGPLPFRDDRGSICYPLNFTGWAWRPELRAAMTGWPGLVEPLEAWVFHATCSHAPFAFLPIVYRDRVRWGSDGKGIVLKLGTNACAGKTMQKVGDAPPFRDLVWAGNITATTRAQILDMIASARDRWHVLTVATDGIYSTEKLAMPAPRDTSTGELINEKGERVEKALGSWEYKHIEEGAFLAKPGLYFRLRAVLPPKGMSDEEKDKLREEVRARGIGRREVFEQGRQLLTAFGTWKRKSFTFGVKLKSRRFFGIKSCTSARSGCERCGTEWPGVPEQLCPKCRRFGTFMFVSQRRTPQCAPCKARQGKEREHRLVPANAPILDERQMYKEGPYPKIRLLATSSRLALLDPHSYCGRCAQPLLGTWGLHEPKVGFDPMPKRERRLEAGGRFARMHVRDVGGAESAPYRGKTTPEGEASRQGRELLEEQPDVEDAPGADEADDA